MKRTIDLASVTLALCCAAACAAGNRDDALEGTPPAHNDAGGGGATPEGGHGGAGVDACGELHADELGAGIDAAGRARFDAAPGADAPFVFDPPSGVRLPMGWPSPAFLVHTAAFPEAAQLALTLAGGEVVRFTAQPIPAPRAHDDSVVEGSWWTIALPADTWAAITCRSARFDWEVSYIATASSEPAGAAGGHLELIGTLSEPDMTYLGIRQPHGQDEGEEFSIERLAVGSGGPQELVDDDDGCIGCHASSPDGQDLLYQRQDELGWRLSVVRPLDAGGTMPSPVMGSAASQVLATTTLMMPGASPGAWDDVVGHWMSAVDPGGRIALVQLDAPENPLTAVIPAFTGSDQALAAASPALAPDGSRILFVATDQMIDGYFYRGQRADLWQMPVTLTKNAPPVFGAATPVAGASNTSYHETHPSFSRDGALITFTRTQPGTGGYDEETAEIWVMPADGSAAPTRIAANDAPEDASVYAGLGLTSSWSRFGEVVATASNGTYYFLLFSSRRGSGELWEDRANGSNHIAGRPIPRLYLATLLLRDDGVLETFPAALVPGQPVDQGAHTATFAAVTSVEPPPPVE
jgi:hypothetical protein